MHKQIISPTAKHAAITLLNELGLLLLNRPVYHPRFRDADQAAAMRFPWIPVRERRWWRRRGFTCDKALLFNRGRLHEYISDLSRPILVERINLRYRAVMIEKSVFDRYCGAVANVVPVLAVSRFGVFQPSIHLNAVASISELVLRARSGDRFVVKPIEGGGGKGVSRIRSRAGGGSLQLDGKDVPDAVVDQSIRKIPRAVVQQEVSPEGYSADIFPDALNTMRIVTMVCPKTGVPFIAAASHKFGTSKSGVVDNWEKGGVLCQVVVDTGELGPGFLYPTSSRGMEQVDAHPDTGARLSGVAIPNWTQFKTEILRVAKDAEFVPYIGWDVAWCGNNITIVEGNTNPGLLTNQVFSPMLACDRVRAFYSHFGVLR